MRLMGPHACIKRISVRHRAINLRQSTATVRGKVAQLENCDEGRLMRIELWAEDENSRRLMDGHAEVLECGTSQ